MQLSFSEYNNNDDEKSSSGCREKNTKNNKTQKVGRANKITIENLANIDEEPELQDFKDESLEHPKAPPNDENITVQPSENSKISLQDIANNDYINYYQKQAMRYQQSMQSGLNQDMNNNNLASAYSSNSNFSNSELQKKNRQYIISFRGTKNRTNKTSE